MSPTDLKLHRKSGILDLSYSDSGTFSLTAEFLRVYSPSAEVRGHGTGQEVLQTGKKNVKINNVEPVGNYAVRLHFDDDHNTGIYSWEYLRELCMNQTTLWDDYLSRLQKAGARREILEEGVQVVNIMSLNDKEN